MFPRSIYQNSNMTRRLSGHFSIFGLVCFCAQVSSGNYETVESWKICKFDPEARSKESSKRIFYVHISYTGNTRSLWWTERLLGFRRPLTFIKGSRQHHSLSIKLFLENLTKTMYFPLLVFSLVNNITNYLSTLTWSSNNDYG